VDYLSEEKIIQTRLVYSGEISPQDVKSAAICLMLNPNATWPRLELIMYARPGLCGKSDIKSLAIQSRFATRIARSIHKYDRERAPLLSFLLRLATLAELDIYGYKSRRGGGGDEGGRGDGGGEIMPGGCPAGGDDAIDFAELSGFGFFGNGDMQAESYYAHLASEKPFGEIVKFPLFKRGEDGRIAPELSPTLKMSGEELKSALVLLLQNEQRERDLIALYRPQTPALNPAELVPKFAEYYSAHYATDKGKREQRLYELVFKMMILGHGNLGEVEAEYRRLYGAKPPVQPIQARYGERGQNILGGFWAWLAETRNS
jgi:hypothetical protein